MLILASRSPRRRMLLQQAGYTFDVIPADETAEDDPLPGEAPAAFVVRLARQKAENVARRIDRGIVLGCDTVVLCDGRILGKPTDREDARAMLRFLRGRRQSVLSGLCLWPVPEGEILCETAETLLEMAALSDERIEEYLDSGLWEGKAGGFGYQDRNDWLKITSGSESNIVGLPLELLERLLSEPRTAYAE